MGQTEIRKLTKEGEEEILSHYRVVVNGDGLEVGVPVVDVRDGLAYMIMAMTMEKASNRSKWINYNQYHQSPKRKKQL